MQNANIRRDDDLLCGRLVAMPSTSTRDQIRSAQLNQGLRNIISVDFPAMPDTIELARSTDYAVNTNMVLPDGIHQYRGTKPLEIPVSFKLHFMDSQYCKQGAYTLLQLAARLHSFVLPVSTFQRGVTVSPKWGSDEATTKTGAGQKKDTSLQFDANKEPIYTVTKASSTKSGTLYSPVTCWLHLMWIGEDMPGVSCIGYVKDVKVVFGGPWNRGPENSFNLPTWAEYSFTFMHRPGHGNNAQFTDSRAEFPSTLAETPQTFADDARDLLYNTRGLVYAANYQGFKDGNETR